MGLAPVTGSCTRPEKKFTGLARGDEVRDGGHARTGTHELDHPAGENGAPAAGKIPGENDRLFRVVTATLRRDARSGNADADLAMGPASESEKASRGQGKIVAPAE